MYSIWVPVVAFLIIAVLAVLGRAYLNAYVKQQKREKTIVTKRSGHGVISKLRSVVMASGICTMCSISLGNSDEKVSDALKYVRPAACLDHILEKRNG